MLNQLRLEGYFSFCKMRVSTAVSLLGWVGIVISLLAVIAGILVAVDDIFHYLPYLFSIPLYLTLPYPVPHLPTVVLIIIFFLILLIINIFLIIRSRAGSFSGVKIIIRILCMIFLSLELVASLVIIIFVGLTVQFEKSNPFFIGILACILEFISIIFVCR